MQGISLYHSPPTHKKYSIWVNVDISDSGFFRSKVVRARGSFVCEFIIFRENTINIVWICPPYVLRNIFKACFGRLWGNISDILNNNYNTPWVCWKIYYLTIFKNSFSFWGGGGRVPEVPICLIEFLIEQAGESFSWRRC